MAIRPLLAFTLFKRSLDVNACLKQKPLMPALQEIYQVDAFSDRPFSGNPAAVCPLPGGSAWPEVRVMQALAMENNLSETAYFKPSQDPGADYDLRWFTPTNEVQLCGHATLASAFVAFEELKHPGNLLRFSTLSGILGVARDPESGLLTLDFPARAVSRCEAPAGLTASLSGALPLETYHSDNGIYLAVFATESEIRALRPDFARMIPLDHSVLVTARGDTADFVSRYFAPHRGVPEDPVTGSAHCILTPFWAERLKKPELFAMQVSTRGGNLSCKTLGDRVALTGAAVLVFKGTLAKGVLSAG
jgi:PhzF family phenazine biosynthesis protein